MRAGLLRTAGLVVVLMWSASFAAKAEAVCLSKPATSSDGSPAKYHVIAAEHEVPRYQVFGFVVEACDVPIDQLQKAVDNVCRMAAATPVGAQAQVNRSHGVSLNQLCQSGRDGLAEMQAPPKPGKP